MGKNKLKFNDLEYIVMEGGGARGAAYLGAIQAMEKKMAARAAADSTILIYPTDGRKFPGLLDYYRKVDGLDVPVIKGIAGSSAGAITTFALGLGFNSDEIKTILEYDFKEFLKDGDVGKYRMVAEDGKLAIGEDQKNKKSKEKELSFGSAFEFDFRKDATEIGDNNAKKAKRALVFGLVFKVIVDGIDSNLKQLVNLIGRIFGVKEPDDARPFWRGLFRWVARSDNSFIKNLGISKAVSLILFKVFIPKVLKSPIAVDPKNITSLFADRGLFSGFKVREFFMDMLIYAATRKTQFHRGLVKLIGDKDIDTVKKIFGSDITQRIRLINTKNLNTDLLKFAGFKIGKRTSSKIGDEIKLELALACMSRITFSHYYQITGVNCGACVSNFSSGLPVYFGYEWTPDFRIMEAVASSMSIPPAIRPVYNAADVKVAASKPARLPFIDAAGNFDLAQFHKYEHLIKIALQKEIFEDERTRGTIVNLNNSIDISTFLPKLRDIVIGQYVIDLGTGNVRYSNPPDLNKKTIITGVDGNEYIIDYNLYTYFYNAQFKGLLLDGGYRNNIPYNFFRARNTQIDSVFAIKLDENYPTPLMDEVYTKISLYLSKIDDTELIEHYELMEQNEEQIRNADPLELTRVFEERSFKVTMEQIENEVMIIFNETLAKWAAAAENATDKKTRNAIRQQISSNKKYIRRLTKSTLKQYKKKRLSPPWTRPVGILNTAFEGYAYGSEKGQVRQISDHNNILPLYDYGIGTYDFDMKKVQAAIDLAQAKAFDSTIEFFN